MEKLSTSQRLGGTIPYEIVDRAPDDNGFLLFISAINTFNVNDSIMSPMLLKDIRYPTTVVASLKKLYTGHRMTMDFYFLFLPSRHSTLTIPLCPPCAMMYQQPPPSPAAAAYTPYHYQGQYQVHGQHQSGNNQIQSYSEDNKTIWIGDLQQWMDETYLQTCFSQTGEMYFI